MHAFRNLLWLPAPTGNPSLVPNHPSTCSLMSQCVKPASSQQFRGLAVPQLLHHYPHHLSTSKCLLTSGVPADVLPALSVLTQILLSPWSPLWPFQHKSPPPSRPNHRHLHPDPWSPILYSAFPDGVPRTLISAVMGLLPNCAWSPSSKLCLYLSYTSSSMLHWVLKGVLFQNH